MNSAYKNAGVDIHAGYKSVELIKGHVRNTFRKEVLSDIGGFGGLFSAAAFKEMKDPVLVSGTDGAGTKLKIAFIMDKHDTIGIDLVAMSVNDVVCCGAEPLFFLDYIACGKNIPEKIEQIVKGIAAGCKVSGVALLGGETAEMPGLYDANEYDLAGFAVGVVDRENIIDGSNIKEGDVLIGLASSGIHSNGYSLVRSILRPSPASLSEYLECLGSTLGEALICPTKIYVKPILSLIREIRVKGISNITGGGFYENIPRMIPKGLKAVIDRKNFHTPPIFDIIQNNGNISLHDMFNTFNMGIGMVVCVSSEDSDRVCDILEAEGEKTYKIGEIARAEDEKRIDLCLE